MRGRSHQTPRRPGRRKRRASLVPVAAVLLGFAPSHGIARRQRGPVGELHLTEPDGDEFAADGQRSLQRVPTATAILIVARDRAATDQRRALLLPQEVKEIGQWKEIIFLENVKPILCDKIRYFDDPEFMGRLLPAPIVKPIDIGLFVGAGLFQLKGSS